MKQLRLRFNHGRVASRHETGRCSPATDLRASGYARRDRKPPNIERLREALEQRATEWRAMLHEEPKVARLAHYGD
jgi:hypothetical protein